jgi:TetR/AcrR family transcriptional regulator
VATLTEQPSRRDRNKLRNQKEILAAALAVFAEKGYRDASVQEIAERADFAVSTLYALFENKADLYRKVSVDIGRMTGAIFDEAMAAGADEYEKLVNCARVKGRIYQMTPAGVRMLENELQSLQNEPGETYPELGIGRIYKRFLVRIQTLFADGIRRGLFVAGDPVLMALALDSSTNALMTLCRNQPEHYTYDERVDEVLDLFFSPVLKQASRKKAQGSTGNA